MKKIKRLLAAVLSMSLVFSTAVSFVSADTVTEYLIGDINTDGKVDLTDLTELSLAIIEDKTLTESQIKAADIDENGKADLPDLARLRQYLSKVIDSLRPGKTESKPVDAEELMLGYYNTTNENQFSDVQSSTRIGIKCKPFCSKTETLKVDVAIADLFTDYNADETTTHYIFDVYPTKDGYWREVEDNNFIVNDGTKISREYSKEEWNLFARNSYESDYDSYYHESAEIDFKNYEAGSEGVIRFIFYVKYDENPSNVQTSGDAQYLYYYVGKNGVGLGNSAENAKNEYFSRFEDELKEDKYTLTISDPFGCLAEAINTVYAPGETIELKFNPMTESYFKVNFNKTEEVSFNGSTYSFVMPESDVEVSIELVEDKI